MVNKVFDIYWEYKKRFDNFCSEILLEKCQLFESLLQISIYFHVSREIEFFLPSEPAQ